MRTIAILALQTAAIALCPVTSFAQGWPPSRDSVTRLLRPWVETGTVPAIVGAVIHSDSTIFVSLGWAKNEQSGPATDSTAFMIGSVAKVFTATLLAEMSLRGEVGLDDPVRRHFPDLVLPRRNGREITLRHLATHTSGLPRDPDNYPSRDPADPRAGFNEDSLRSFLSRTQLTRDPGESYEYSNLGMSLLGHVLARRAGKSYEALVTERILVPLRMRDTHIAATPVLEAREAVGHTPDLEPMIKERSLNSVLLGSGAWWSSIRDMARFARAAINTASSPIGPALDLAMKATRQWGEQTATVSDSIGLGWHVVRMNGKQLAWHNGGTAGFMSMFAIDPIADRGVIVLSNSNVSDRVDNIAWHLLDSTIPFRPPVARPAIAIDAAIARRYIGEYRFPSGSRSRVYEDKGKLYYEPRGVPRMQLYAESDTKFFLKTGRDVEFVLDASGKVTEVIIRNGDREFRAARVEE